MIRIGSVRDDTGISGVAYGLLAALIAGAALFAIQNFGNQVADKFDEIASIVEDGEPEEPIPGDNFDLAFEPDFSVLEDFDHATVGDFFEVSLRDSVRLTDPGTITINNVFFIVVQGALPPGIEIDNDTGRITGTPTEQGETTFAIAAAVGDVTSEPFTIVMRVGAPFDDVARVVSGSHHTCALRTNGSVFCWGRNTQGQLGVPGSNVEYLPLRVASLGETAVSIAAGDNFTCVVRLNGTVWCWGENTDGQLGNNTTNTAFEPVQVLGLVTPAVDVTAGSSHACAILTSGLARCWGKNDGGQLGDGSQTDRRMPANAIDLGEEIVSIHAGAAHTCALTVEGAVYCWGSNVANAVGSGAATNQLEPWLVSGLGSGVMQLSSAGRHSCALRDDASAVCWGNNANGQLGRGDSGNSNGTIDTVMGLTGGVTAVSVGRFHSCAVLTSGQARCWGYNLYGQLGNGTIVADSPIPSNVVGMSSGIIDFGLGTWHSCAVISNGQVKCWGSNNWGMLGIGREGLRTRPVLVKSRSL